MAENHIQELNALKARIEKMGSYLHIDDKRKRVSELDEQAAAPGFWDDQQTAQSVMSKAAALRDEIEEYDFAVSELEDAEVANEMALEEDDEDLEGDVRRWQRALATAMKEESVGVEGEKLWGRVTGEIR